LCKQRQRTGKFTGKEAPVFDEAAPQPNRWRWSWTTPAPVFVLLLFGEGCVFSPPSPAGKIMCSVDQECPSNLPFCSAERCTARSDAASVDMPTIAADPAVDAAIDIGPDGAADLPVAREVGSDGAADLPPGMDVAADGGPDRAPDVGMEAPAVEAQPDNQPPPLTVVLSAGTSTAIRGNTGADTTVDQDACPNNTALIGFHVGTNSSQNQGIEVVSQLQAVCGSLTVSADRTTIQVTPGGS
jgi:hypothetical protein